jgi:PBP1b-binding outer membrane lipoprotein LpoB
MDKRSVLLIALAAIFILVITGCSDNPVAPSNDEPTTYTTVDIDTDYDTIPGPTDCYLITDSGTVWVPCNQ